MQADTIAELTHPDFVTLVATLSAARKDGLFFLLPLYRKRKEGIEDDMITPSPVVGVLTRLLIHYSQQTFIPSNCFTFILVSTILWVQ